MSRLDDFVDAPPVLPQESSVRVIPAMVEEAAARSPLCAICPPPWAAMATLVARDTEGGEGGPLRVGGHPRSLRFAVQSPG